MDKKKLAEGAGDARLDVSRVGALVSPGGAVPVSCRHTMVEISERPYGVPPPARLLTEIDCPLARPSAMRSS